MQDKTEVIETEEIEDIQEATLEKMGEVIEKVEKSKQITALKQIEATDKDNERQYQFALQKDQTELAKWNKAFWIGSISTIVLGGVSLYLILTQDDKSLGIGLLASTITGVFGFIAGSGSCNK